MKTLSALSLVLALAAFGCSASAPPPPAAGGTRQAIVTEQPGPLRAVGLAFAGVPLSPEQRTRIEALFRATERRHAEAWKGSTNARKDLLLALADQVQAGAIDKAALAPKLEAAAAPWRTAHEADRAALVDLHATLTPNQRKAFAVAFHPGKMRHAEHAKGKHGDHAKGQHAATLRERGFGHAWKELDLTSDQKDKLKEAMQAARGKDRGKGEAFAQRRELRRKALESFSSDTFTGEGLFHANRAEGRPEHLLQFVEIATPILTPEQRTKAGAMLRERAAKASERMEKHR